MWKKAIKETLLLIRMEKETHNKRVRDKDGEAIQKVKLDYQELIPCLKEITSTWEQMLALHEREDEGGGDMDDETENTVPNSRLLDYAKRGVPPHIRGRIWLFLVQQRRLSSAVPSSRCDSREYDQLLRETSPHQHAILIDTGRTFPGHPYFSKRLGPGQQELFNILKAYSVVDGEVGYCQGLCFIVGILVMHMEEISAFHVLKYVMYDLGLRKQFRPNMLALQIRLFQLKRLIHDHYREVYDHFENHEITPSLYATPWFLTVFASQFPLGFVVRVFDMIFVQGIDAMFKIALMLIGNFRAEILECDSFEDIAEFLKLSLPEKVHVKMVRILNQAFELDIKKELQAYEVEYYISSEEMTYSNSSKQNKSSGSSSPATPPARQLNRRRKSIDVELMHKMARINQSLRTQNSELIDKLQHAQSQLRSSELSLCALKIEVNKLKSYSRVLEQERTILLSALAKLYKLIPRDVLTTVIQSLSNPSTRPPSPVPYGLTKGNFGFNFPLSLDVQESASDSSSTGSPQMGNGKRCSIDLDDIYNMERENTALKKLNMELIERIQRTQMKQHTSEVNLCTDQIERDKLKSKVRAMELERATLLNTVAKLWTATPREARKKISLDTSLPSTPPESPSTSGHSRRRFFSAPAKASKSNSPLRSILPLIRASVNLPAANSSDTKQPSVPMSSDTETRDRAARTSIVSEKSKSESSDYYSATSLESISEDASEDIFQDSSDATLDDRLDIPMSSGSETASETSLEVLTASQTSLEVFSDADIDRTKYCSDEPWDECPPVSFTLPETIYENNNERINHIDNISSKVSPAASPTSISDIINNNLDDFSDHKKKESSVASASPCQSSAQTNTDNKDVYTKDSTSTDNKDLYTKDSTSTDNKDLYTKDSTSTDNKDVYTKDSTLTDNKDVYTKDSTAVLPKPSIRRVSKRLITGLGRVSSVDAVANGLGPVSSVEEEDDNQNLMTWPANVARNQVDLVWC